MQVKATIKPGQNGSKRYLRQYGDQLICVRYRYDARRNKRITTIELAVAEQDWMPGVRHQPDQLIYLRVTYSELELRDQVKREGAFLGREKKAWRLSKRRALALGLERRIIDVDVDI